MSFEIRRGDIFYIQKGWAATGSEQQPGRPGVIVSNNGNNKHSDTVEIVYCTTRIKAEMPTHTTVLSTPYESTVLCEQVTTVSVDRLGDYIGRCTEAEMREIDHCILISLDLESSNVSEQENPLTAASTSARTNRETDSREMLVLRVERDTYKKMYELTVSKIAEAVADVQK